MNESICLKVNTGSSPCLAWLRIELSYQYCSRLSRRQQQSRSRYCPFPLLPSRLSSRASLPPPNNLRAYLRIEPAQARGHCARAFNIVEALNRSPTDSRPSLDRVSHPIPIARQLQLDPTTTTKVTCTSSTWLIPPPEHPDR